MSFFSKIYMTHKIYISRTSPKISYIILNVADEKNNYPDTFNNILKIPAKPFSTKSIFEHLSRENSSYFYEGRLNKYADPISSLP